MSQLNLSTLIDACKPGGASVLTLTTELEPAAGTHGGVAPARYVSGTNATYNYERRYFDGSAMWTALLDSNGSQSNRAEECISQAIDDGLDPLSRTPRISLAYPDGQRARCLTLPHRAYDGHLRSGTIDGQPATSHPSYRALRDATAANARPLLEASPCSVAFGSWDSTRRSHQVRFRSALRGEIIGVLADQSDVIETPKRGGARVDSLSPSVRLSGVEMEQLLREQEAELSPNNVESIRKSITKAGKTGTVSASPLGLGSIPPSLTGLGLVSCQRIVRSQVLSFSALRQLRFGGPLELDVACRALLAAWILVGVARANQELSLRANCDLVEAAPQVVRLDQRQGEFLELEDLSIDAADSILSEAIASATTHGIRWEGQELAVLGNPSIIRGAEALTEDE